MVSMACVLPAASEMPVFHAPAHCANHSERGEQALARLVEQVNALRARPMTGEDFEGVERELRAGEAAREDPLAGRRGHHVLRFHRQMPTGWPEGDHHEADESALTGRTAPVGGGAKLYLGVPMLTADRVQVLGFDVGGLDRVVAWTQDVTD